MPNWCQVRVEVCGPQIFRDEFLAKLGDGENRTPLQVFVPCDPELLVNPRYTTEGYDWCVKHWGVKWSESSFSQRKLMNSCVLRFASPWAAPIDGYQAVSKLFPRLVFAMTFDEPGMGFMGSVLFQNGQILFEHEIADELYPEWSDEDSGEEWMIACASLESLGTLLAMDIVNEQSSRMRVTYL